MSYVHHIVLATQVLCDDAIRQIEPSSNLPDSLQAGTCSATSFTQKMIGVEGDNIHNYKTRWRHLFARSFPAAAYNTRIKRLNTAGRP